MHCISLFTQLQCKRYWMKSEIIQVCLLGDGSMYSEHTLYIQLGESYWVRKVWLWIECHDVFSETEDNCRLYNTIETCSVFSAKTSKLSPIHLFLYSCPPSVAVHKKRTTQQWRVNLPEHQDLQSFRDCLPSTQERGRLFWCCCFLLVWGHC